ncbi:hypothetical protein BTM25_43410 [Actinomadura rubteroloni]|uniref:Fumarylacetoacetase-like C-terminal domain-containing protein n=1 Tax=Actinomadura rubteroloni TaxID=1926885 RepID=A0A2P4UDR7_9ACTN|nr:fumarylacetoacetate hydrolase family protein [Actinomadura rubteroloni]POM23189.1 hypothetical protein BTM25_43410 [Actinomadura rubteroloni]
MRIEGVDKVAVRCVALSGVRGERLITPTGPWLLTRDEFGNPDDLCSINGAEVQRGRTRDLISSIPALIAKRPLWASAAAHSAGSPRATSWSRPSRASTGHDRETRPQTSGVILSSTPSRALP